MSKIEEKRKAYLLSANHSKRDIEEMVRLLITAGYNIVAIFAQNIKRGGVNKSLYFGSGKLLYIKDAIAQKEENLDDITIVTNVDLSATQKRNLEEIFETEIVDRTELILEIFRNGAHTAESKLQVEIANLKYSQSKLVNEGANYAQVTSGSGHNKGSGEKQKELSRREIANAIRQKEKQLENIKKARRTGRNLRNSNSLPIISVVGYTNAGKSTLINALINFSKKKPGKNVLAEDKLFATLETSSRLINVYNYPSFIISDTVGFVSNLPHFLVAAFRSTLEEIVESDYIIEVVDASSPFYVDEMKTTNEVLEQLGAKDISRIVIYNKSELANDFSLSLKPNELLTSLINEDEIEGVYHFILHNITSSWKTYSVNVPFDYDMRMLSSDNYVIAKIKKDDSYLCQIRFNPSTIHKYKDLLDK